MRPTREQALQALGPVICSHFEQAVTHALENISGYVDGNGRRREIFGEGGGAALAEELDVPLLGSTIGPTAQAGAATTLRARLTDTTRVPRAGAGSQ